MKMSFYTTLSTESVNMLYKFHPTEERLSFCDFFLRCNTCGRNSSTLTLFRLRGAPVQDLKANNL